MADDSAQDRSLPASERRLEQAREEGRAVRSTEFSTALVLIAAALCFWWLGGGMFERLRVLLASGLTLTAADAFDPARIGVRFMALALEALWISLPLLGALCLAAVAAPLLVGGWVFSMQVLEFKPDRIDPLAGLGRIFSSQGAFNLAKAVVKVVVLGAAMYWLLRHYPEQLLGLAGNEARGMLGDAGDVLARSFLLLAGVTVLIVLMDLPFQLWKHYSELRMTREEFKEEHKESEGDPHVRSRIRQRQREVSRRRMMAAVPKADVVVTNPTHYAVAVRYQEDGMRAPLVVAKGTGLVAQRIREIAAEHGVPRLEAPPLARALWRHAEVDGEIPVALYGAVAQVLAWVYQLRQARQGGTGQPAPVSEPPAALLAVPPELDPATGMEAA